MLFLRKLVLFHLTTSDLTKYGESTYLRIVTILRLIVEDVKECIGSRVR